MDERRRMYWELHDFSKGRGLEVGPLHRPIVGRDEGDVHYVDVMDRAGLIEHYADDPSVPAEAIPEIDYFLIQEDGRTSTLVEATKAGAPFDWVMASHVIEHVPDLIGWLAELAEVVVDGGALVLAVPDKRYCFDVHRPPTTVGQLVRANLSGDIRPSTGAVYDYFSSSVDYDVQALWRGEYPTYDRRIHSLEVAEQHVQKTLDGEYVDCHVWLFTPESFLRQMQELRHIGRSSWVVERLEPTPRNDLEFRVVMRRVPRDADATGPQTAELAPSGQMPDWLEERPTADALERRIEKLQLRLDRRGARLRRLRRRVRRQRRELELLRSSRAVAVAQALSTRLRRLRSRGR